jgi:hypothetical protein
MARHRDDDDVINLLAVRPAPPRRKIYGYVYELITGDPRDGEHPYVGMTERTIHQRVRGAGGHTSPESVAKDPWKARILPGRAGYRCLERVYDTGDLAENDRALRRAEAFWIDRLRPTHNDVRPVRPPLHEARPVRRPARPLRTLPAPRRRKFPVRAWLFISLFMVMTAVVSRGAYLMGLPSYVPWVISPVVAGFLSWRVFWSAHRSIRRLMR